MSNELGVGKEILSYCNRCKLSLAHIITVMKNEKVPLKVQCKTCKSTHAHKDTSAPPPKKKKAFGKDTSKKLVSWDDRMIKATGEKISYSVKAQFHVGDLINHPTFGVGFVESIVDNNKILVLFKTDSKTLMHNKK